jgi:hypothetical protein
MENQYIILVCYKNKLLWSNLRCHNRCEDLITIQATSADTAPGPGHCERKVRLLNILPSYDAAWVLRVQIRPLREPSFDLELISDVVFISGTKLDIP